MRVRMRVEKLLKGLQIPADMEKITTDVIPRDFSCIADGLASNAGTSRSSPLLSSAAESDDPGTPTGSDSARGLLQQEITNMVQQLGDSRALVAKLEAEITLLQQEKCHQEMQNGIYIKRLESQLRHMEERAELDLAELKRRQNMIESEVPGLVEQLKSIKDIFQDLNVSEPLYAELAAVPEEKRSLRDYILILAYESMQKFRKENEELRLERDTSREASARANDEVDILKWEIERMLSKATYEKRDMEMEMDAANLRYEKMELRLKDAFEQAHQLEAKGALYDEVKEKLDGTERVAEQAKDENVALKAAVNLMMEEKHLLLEAVKEKDHVLELLRMDKEHLNKDVKVQEERVKQLECERECQREKISELKQARQDLYNRLLFDSKDSQTAQEHRLQVELLRLQGQAKEDIEHLRKEATEAAEREVRTLREMRDLALHDAERTHLALQENRSDYDELLTKYREFQRIANSKEIETRTEIQMKQFELDRINVVLEETRSLLNQKKLENEALYSKVNILTEKYHELELEMNEKILKLRNELEAAHLHLDQMDAQDQKICDFLLSAGKEEEEQQGLRIERLGATVPTGVLQRLQQSSNLVKKCIQLQHTINILENERKDLLQKVTKKSAEADKACKRLNHLQQPHLYLVKAIEQAEEKLNDAIRAKDSLENELREIRKEKDEVLKSFQKMKDDMKRLLQARGSVENLQKILLEKSYVSGITLPK
ncbi:hypothetical protein O6H91_18G033100 [Diphasiastrum complanatum]|uniref:Uncharacterized protein n=3 Tax=Diphasiastrum complanatum TaxID=34168 RepID=A0ACC2AZQ3_DIPCM|nr:hypothetical protein O6H91_18G033100 [Diphasiastrum complanatum]KAJ7522967.1 hypothetical protein O6H91_18G033100 [Diphasiastrum complanatum]KAJ7522969.1 hypothetical protein O6H91_18G033100 [Diphasiastrum complanatum]